MQEASDAVDCWAWLDFFKFYVSPLSTRKKGKKDEGEMNGAKRVVRKTDGLRACTFGGVAAWQPEP